MKCMFALTFPGLGVLPFMFHACMLKPAGESERVERPCVMVKPQAARCFARVSVPLKPGLKTDLQVVTCAHTHNTVVLSLVLGSEWALTDLEAFGGLGWAWCLGGFD